MPFTAYHAKYYAHELTRQHATGDVGQLTHSLFDASVDLNPHQIEAALFALRNPLQEGVLLADEVGLGKTIEAALVLCQYWAERRRNLLVICPASLRKQWAQELEEKFAVPSVVIDRSFITRHYNGDAQSALRQLAGKKLVIMSYPFAVKLETQLRGIIWDAVVIDEAHKLRHAHRDSNRTGQALKRALAGRKKLLLTATPLQNSLLELYGLSYVIDEHLFGDARAFRKQYMQGESDLQELRQRTQGFVHRTLRRDVLEYIQYTQRHALTQPFEPTDAEQALYDNISTFLQRGDTYALPSRHRHLIALIIRKLLASSAYAVIGTLQTIRQRLQKQLDDPSAQANDLVEQLTFNDNLEEDYLDEADNTPDWPKVADTADDQPNAQSPGMRQGIQAEIEEITGYIDQAQSLATDSKAQALLKALDAGFSRMAQLGANRKAIIFTESRRTQEYLYRFLSEQGYTDKLALFSGSNDHPSSKAIYQQWLDANRDTDRVTGSKPVDRRTALIDHFRKDDGADILIATEAAAEGVNLQFCSLVINYDLPWNPQRVEQRIGRCHRYGQKHDVVVINFLNTRNEADKRVLELLSEKFRLFDGVFGASDEILGKIESGIDFEKRILGIYDTCRTPEEIETAFNALQTELEDEIAARIQQTQAQLLENFDQDVHDRLKLRLDEAKARLDQIGRWFWGVTRYALNQRARFDTDQFAFSLTQPPGTIEPGRYQLVRGATQPDMLAHAYRLSHPLGEWCIGQGLSAATPQATLTLDYAKLDAKLSVVEPLRGHSGWLTLVHLQVTAFETTEALLFSGLTDSGQPLDQDTCEKLLAVPAASKPKANADAVPGDLLANSKQLTEATIARVLDDNQQLFNAERDKLERWADDKVLAAEQSLRQTKERIKQRKRDARHAATLQEQEPIQQEIRTLERQKRRQRQQIFAVEDEIMDKRDELIDSLQQRMQQDSTTKTLFTLRWKLA